MEKSYIDTADGRMKFLDAVDMVCINCHYCKEEYCETCPVRNTCDELATAAHQSVARPSRTYRTDRHNSVLSVVVLKG